MPTEISQTIDSVRSILAQVPGAFLAIALLVGPTLAWLAYRFLNAKPRSRYVDEDGKALWICTNCRSASELARSRCYRCGWERGDPETLELVAPPAAGSGGPDPRIAFPGIGVGPGPSQPMPTGLGPVGSAASAADAQDASGAERAPVAVGPGRPPVTQPRRYVVADRPIPVALPDAPEAPDAEDASAEDASAERTPAGAGSDRTSAGATRQR